MIKILEVEPYWKLTGFALGILKKGAFNPTVRMGPQIKMSWSNSDQVLKFKKQDPGKVFEDGVLPWQLG